jgi:LuxR family transcriptional regulator, maltose regulon positive regulatory protein
VRLADDNLNADNSLSGASGQGDNINGLLQSIQIEYQIARRQLEQVDRHLAEKQIQISRHLQRSYVSSTAFQPLCLVEYNVANPANQLGRTILGGSSRPIDWPIPAYINIRCFGRFDVRSNTARIDHWHSVKAKSVFQYLLTRPHEPTLRDTLMEVLWPECSPQAAANNLKVAVHQLKLTLSCLGDQMKNLHHILFLQGSYLINPLMNLRIDVEEFEKHWNSGRQFEKERNITEAIREYENAEVLYLGDYLAEEIYDEWTLLRREALKDTYLIILSKLAEHGTLVNDYESCIHYSQKMLAQDNCREDAYRLLMYCYHKLGQRNRAIRWYEICCRIIRSELEIAPDKRTTGLYQSILRDAEN